MRSECVKLMFQLKVVFFYVIFAGVSRYSKIYVKKKSLCEYGFC